MDFAFGEDVDPAVAAAGVEGGGGEGVGAVGCVGEFGGGERVAWGEGGWDWKGEVCLCICGRWCCFSGVRVA